METQYEHLDLSPDEMSALAAAQPQLVRPGCSYFEGTLTGPAAEIGALRDYLDSPAWTSAASDWLDRIKADLCAAVDAAAETERGRYITLGAGQAMTYQSKAIEAAALAGDASPDPADYPLLSAEVGITASDLAGVGVAVRARQAAWAQIGAVIEGARLAAKHAVTAAPDAAAARAAAVVAWPEA